MSGDERRFEATPAKRERARREGNVARSAELAGVVAFAAALGALVLAGPALAAAAASAVVAAAVGPAPGPARLGTLALAALAPLAAGAGAGALAALAQTGGLRVAGLRFAPDRLAPGPGLRRLFGADALVAALRATLAFATAGLAVVPAVTAVVAAAGTAGSLTGVATAASAGALQACAAACGVGLLFALADYALARRRWLRQLRMSFGELKRDLREQDGDPQTRQRRRSLHRALARGGVARTREASFVVVNPTHLAIALRYAPPAVPVPELLVRAADALALRVRAIAERAGVPIVEDVALARLLYRSGAAGRPIPPETFVAVAHVVAALVRAGVLEG